MSDDIEKQNKRLSVINSARLLEVSWARFEEVICKEKETLLKKLLYSYRTGDYDLPKIAGEIGAYASLEDVEAKIKKAILEGRKEQGEIFNVRRNEDAG